ncbi:MAG: hypothetical protein K5841_11015 [Fretibacterium sp.]|nr:hypothetical protein [Fretibacterium sp.]
MGMKFLSALKGRAGQGSRDVEPEENGSRRSEGGKLYDLWLLVLPLLLGLALGWFAAVCLGIALDRFAGSGTVQQGGALEMEAVRREDKDTAGLDGFLAANPFRVSPLPSAVPEPKEEKPAEPEVKGSLADAVVRGTLPGVGVWLEDKGQTHLVLLDTSFDVYTLSEVTYREAVFVHDDEVAVLELLYGAPSPKTAGKPVPAAPKAAPANVPVGNVVAATEEQDGQVPSELVNQLVQNPFDELKKVRLRPKEGESGLEIQWIQNDSILKQLGVQKGDVVKGVNGIPFSNMADIANSINSLMNSERFDVEVTRGGKPTSLRYVVR